MTIYQYEDEEGRVLLRKIRYLKNPPSTDEFPFPLPKKAFKLEARRQHGYVWIRPADLERMNPGRHEYHHSLLYNLPRLLLDGPGEVWLTEGEKDADALVGVGVAALSHWQGAQNFTQSQAERFRGYRGRVVLAIDNDPSGAACAVRRYDLLREVGIPERRLRMVVAAAGLNDVHDHIVGAGLGLDAFREPPSLDKVRVLARRAPAPSPAGRDYDPGDGFNLKDWRPQVASPTGGAGRSRRPARPSSSPHSARPARPQGDESP